MENIEIVNERVQYNRELHRYYIDGNPVPSVTEIINNKFKDFAVGGKLSCMPSFMKNMQAAANFGNKIHDFTDQYDKGELTKIEIKKMPDKEQTHMIGWLNFLKDFDLEIATIDNTLLSEYLIYSYSRYYAGRFDRICRKRKDGALVMVDLKCTFEIPATVGLQTAGYTHGFEEMHPGIKIKERMCCQLTGEGKKKYEYLVCTDRLDVVVFLAKLTSLQWDRKNGQ